MGEWCITDTLEVLINVPGRLFIFGKEFTQDALIKLCPGRLFIFRIFPSKTTHKICLKPVFTDFGHFFARNDTLLLIDIKIISLKFLGKVALPEILIYDYSDFSKFPTQDAYSVQDAYYLFRNVPPRTLISPRTFIRHSWVINYL